MISGWIKIHRQLLNKGWFKKSNYVHVWTYLLIRASFSESEYMWNGENIKLKPGQFVTGRKQISKDTGIPESTIERILDFFEKNEQQIGQQKTNTSRLISILNYDSYQNVDRVLDNGWTTDGQRMDTNKEVQEGKEREEVATADSGYKKLGERGRKLFEMFRRNLPPKEYSDQEVIDQVNMFENKYSSVMVNNSGALVNTWCGNLRNRSATQKTEKRLSSFI